MKVATIVLLCLIASQPAVAQVADRKGGAVIAADFNYRATLDRCTVRRTGTGATVVAKMFVRFQPDQRLPATTALDVEVSGGPGGDLPTVSAHAINTKGTGAQNGRAASQACAAELAPRTPVAARLAPEAATCTVSGGADAEWNFTLPLASLAPAAAAKNYVGHVTLIKRGDAAGAATIVAHCASVGGARAGYDLAVSKKV